MGERSGLLKSLINIYKYKYARSCAVVFADLLFEAFGAFAADKVIVPLPTIEKHKRLRGFDHTGLLARRIAWRCGGVRRRLLERQNSTVQVGADAETRRRQAGAAYGAVNSIDTCAEYLLLDDVWTTGSSMLAACEQLQKAGARKIAVVLLAKSG